MASDDAAAAPTAPNIAAAGVGGNVQVLARILDPAVIPEGVAAGKGKASVARMNVDGPGEWRGERPPPVARSCPRCQRVTDMAKGNGWEEKLGNLPP